MGNLLDRQVYYNYGDLFGDENIICNSIIENYKLGTMEEIVDDIIEKNIPDAATLYSKCAELESYFEDAYNEENFKGNENSIYEVLKVAYREYIGQVLGFNFDDIIFNLCVEHANEILQEDNDLTYSEEKLNAFLNENCFDNYTAIDDIRNLLEEDIKENEEVLYKDVNMNDLTSRIDDLTDKIENFINNLDCEEDIHIYFYSQRVSENKVCISIDITDED